MPARLRYGRRFVKDFQEQEAWLIERGELDWLRQFRDALDEVKRLVTRFPEIGVRVRSGERSVLRALSLPHGLPFLVYYRHARRRPIREVSFVRLYHHAQERPVPGAGESQW